MYVQLSSRSNGGTFSKKVISHGIHLDDVDPCAYFLTGLAEKKQSMMLVLVIHP